MQSEINEHHVINLLDSLKDIIEDLCIELENVHVSAEDVIKTDIPYFLSEVENMKDKLKESAQSRDKIDE